MKQRSTFTKLGAIAVLIAVAVLARMLAPTSGDQPLIDPLGFGFEKPAGGLLATGTGLGLLLLGAWLLGKVVYDFGVSKITGFLLFGMLVGPDVTGILQKDQLEYLKLSNDLAISLIALTAGGEIELGFIRRSLKLLTSILTVQIIAILLIVSGAMFLVFQGASAFSELTQVQILMIALVVGTIATASSPAVVIAILAETGAKGAMAQTTLAAAVCKDLILVVLFSIVLSVASGVVLGSGGSGSELTLYLITHLGGSVLAGVIVGVALAAYVKLVTSHLSIVIVGASFAIALFGKQLDLEPLIVALTAGLVMRNAFGSSTEKLFSTVETLSLPVYTVFFAVAGAKIDPAKLLAVWPAVLALVCARAGAVWAGTHIGVRAAGVSGPTRTWAWTAFIPQAGVSLALALVVQREFSTEPLLSDMLFNLLLSAIAVHELVGPILYKIGLTLAEASETHAEPSPPPSDG